MLSYYRKKKSLKMLAKFWAIYDEYIVTFNKELLPELSRLLSLIESNDRDTQLLRPEKGWTRILAWQVSRDQEFIFGTKKYTLSEGEVLAISGVYTIYLSRVEQRFEMPGAILKPGYKLSYKDRGEMSAHKWHHKISTEGIVNESGLYIPLYDEKDVITAAFMEAETIKERVISFLQIKMITPMQYKYINLDIINEKATTKYCSGFFTGI